jgi:hypothetical protein
MLNELHIIERGLRAAGIAVAAHDPGISLLSKSERPLRVRLAKDGKVDSVELIDAALVLKLWTQRDGNHNSFPLVKTNGGLLQPAQLFERWDDMPPGEQRKLFAGANRGGFLSPKDLGEMTWPTAGLLSKLEERLAALAKLEGSDAAAVPAVMVRFRIACKEPGSLLSDIATIVAEEAEEGDEGWLEAAKALLTEKTSLYFDVPRHEFTWDVGDGRQMLAVTEALHNSEVTAPDGLCALGGKKARLISGNFPKPTLAIGQIYLFSKNPDTPAASRYGRSAEAAFPIGHHLTEKLAGALRALSVEQNKGKTWGTIPGEKPKQIDHLLAFVEASPDESVAELMCEDGEEIDAVAAFEVRTLRIMKAIEARVGADFRKTPVQLCILRKVDPGNAKAVFHRQFSVGELFDAASQWCDGELNIPPWLTMPVSGQKAEKRQRRHPPHLAPFRVPALTRRQYIRGGLEYTEVIGVTAADIFALFLNEGDFKLRVKTTLKLLLRRYVALLSGAAHSLSRGQGRKKDKEQDYLQALTAISLIGVLLVKLGRRKEEYMSEAAFRLGQLLAAADTVHIGYCADMRGGDMPPTLLGNAVLATAQSNPIKALALLSGRWKPYGGWAKHVDLNRAKKLCNSEDKAEQQRGWAIRRAVSQAWRAGEITRELHQTGMPQSIDDEFRAELLLGYVAGLPKVEREAHETDNMNEGDRE